MSFSAVPVEETGFPSWVGGEVDGWDGRVGEKRGTAEWVVPDGCDMSSRVRMATFLKACCRQHRC